MLFPSITASGIPKNAALNAIMQIEKTPQSSSGAILLLDDMRFDAALVCVPYFRTASAAGSSGGMIAQLHRNAN